jgi:hypothetical protein
MRGTSREQLREQAAVELAAARAADQAHHRARGEAEHHERVGQLPRGTTAAHALAELENGWTEREQELVGADIEAATTRARTVAGLAQVGRDAAQERVDELDAEAAYREQPDPQARIAQADNRDRVLA